MDDTLIPDIEAFIEHHELSEWQFGALSLNDKHFLKQLREGREPRRATRAKVRSFMSTYSAEDAAA